MKKLAYQQPRVELGHDWRGGLLWLLAAVLLLGWLDALDNADWHRRAAERAAAELQRELDARPLPPHLPPVTFVLEARTREGLKNRLAEVAGAADLARHKLREGK
jgi:hypothetical protein